MRTTTLIQNDKWGVMLWELYWQTFLTNCTFSGTEKSIATFTQMFKGRIYKVLQISDKLQQNTLATTHEEATVEGDSFCRSKALILSPCIPNLKTNQHFF